MTTGQHFDGTHDEAVLEVTEDMVADGVATLRWQLHDLILAGARVLVVDVSRIEQLSSTAVAALLWSHRACRVRGGGVVLRRPNRRTLELLHRTGLWRVLSVEEPAPDTVGLARAAS
jgi:anti-anti-sigma factor